MHWEHFDNIKQVLIQICVHACILFHRWHSLYMHVCTDATEDFDHNIYKTTNDSACMH